MFFRLTLIAAVLSLVPLRVLGVEMTDNIAGLKTVVIDPGHGGKDPGARSADRKVCEKDIALSIALEFGSRIKSEFPDVKVIYTRTTDKTVELSNRAEIANRNNADLFVSIHINSFGKSSPNGYSAHVLGPSRDPSRDLFSSNMELCKRENSVILLEEDYSAKYQGFNPNDTESYIIFNLLQNSHLNNSILFAELVQKNLSANGPFKTNRGVSQDPFLLLHRTAMPAVLLELGFISNPSDLAVLKSKSGRRTIVDKLFSAFAEYKKIYDSASGTVELPPLQEVSSVHTATTDISQENPSGTSQVRYGVQIFALSRRLSANDPALKGIKCEVIRSGKLYRYVAGVTSSKDSAVEYARTVSKKFPDAYPVKIEDGQVSILK